MDKFKTIGVGGLPHTLNDFRQFLGRLDVPSEGIYQAFNNMLGGFGTDFIVQGCVVSGSTGAFSITEGWILLNSELIKVDAQGPFDEVVDGTFIKVTTFDSRGTKTFLNGSINETYEKNRGIISGTGGTLDFNGKTFFSLTNQAAFRDDTPSEQPLVTLNKKVIEIGAWNMDTTAAVVIAHGITGLDVKKVRTTLAMIDDPTGSAVRPLNKMNVTFNAGAISGGVTSVSATDVTLNRQSGGDFDSAVFSSTGINRGWITIEYES